MTSPGAPEVDKDAEKVILEECTEFGTEYQKIIQDAVDKGKTKPRTACAFNNADSAAHVAEVSPWHTHQQSAFV